MKSFKEYIKEYDERSWVDPMERMGEADAMYDDWCRRNPDHENCDEWREKQKKKEGKK